MNRSKYEEQLEKAKAIVIERYDQGENDNQPIEKSFLHGVVDVFAIIYMKTVRVDGRYHRGDRETILEELHDIINYAAFAAAMIEAETTKIDFVDLYDGITSGTAVSSLIEGDSPV